MLTKSQLRAACLRIENVVKFCEDYDLPRRTVMRMRTREASPTRRTIQKLEAALIMEDLVSGDTQSQRGGRKAGGGAQRKVVA